MAAAAPERRIVSFEQDEAGHWVARLECGHTQHVRHDPPWQVREWTTSREGRDAMVGERLRCPECGGATGGRSARAGVALLSAFLLAFAPAPAAAQGDGTPSGDEQALFDGDDAWIAAGFVIGTAALAPLDLAVADAIQDGALQEHRILGGSASVFRSLGHPGAVIASGGLYLGGLLSGERGLADAGLHTGEAIMVAEALTYTLKSLVGRARPYMNSVDPFDFELMRGWGRDDYRSFPSGHATAAFAAAAALTTEVSIHEPDLRDWVGVLLYGSAALVGVSRLYHNEHWVSDVVAGAAVGTFGGWKTVRWMHAHPNNELDRLLLPDEDEETERRRPPVRLMWSVPLN